MNLLNLYFKTGNLNFDNKPVECVVLLIIFFFSNAKILWEFIFKHAKSSTTITYFIYNLFISVMKTGDKKDKSSE